MHAGPSLPHAYSPVQHSPLSSHSQAASLLPEEPDLHTLQLAPGLGTGRQIIDRARGESPSLSGLHDPKGGVSGPGDTVELGLGLSLGSGLSLSPERKATGP